MFFFPSIFCTFSLHAYMSNVASVTRYYQTETVHSRCDGSSVVQVASCSTHTAAEGNDCSLKMFRVDTCAHSVYRQQLSWYEGRDPPSSRRLWCNGRQTSQYRLSGNVEVGRGEEGRQTPMARPSHPDYLVPPPVRAPQRLQWPRQTWFIEVDAIKSFH